MPAKKARKRKSSRTGLLVVGGVIGVVAIAALWLLLTPPTDGSTNVKDFTLPVVGANGETGQQFSLSSLKGKVVLLEFMEPWCVHCQHMAPTLDQIYSQYNGQVAFLSVSGPYQGATVATTATFIQTYENQWPFVYDSSGSVFTSYGVSSTPVFFFLDKSGSVSSSLEGELTASQITAAISAAGG